jgi:invasion protein IalB
MMKGKKSLLIATVWVMGLSGAGTAAAQNPKLIGSYSDWKALTFQEQGASQAETKSGCYTIAEPIRKEGAYSTRGRVYALVTHRPTDKKLNVITIIAGYEFKEGSGVTVEVGDEKFSLFTQQDMAWASDEDDAKIVDAMKKGSDMVVHGVSAKGAETTDTYSLIGFTKAYNAIGQACGLAQ